MKHTQSNTSTALTILIALFAIVVGIYGFLIYKINHISENIGFLAQQIEIQSIREDRLKELSIILTQTREERGQFTSYLLHENDIVTFIKNIETLGEHTNVDVEFKTINVTQIGQKDALGLYIVAKGTFSNVFYFLSLFESLPYVFSFDRIFIQTTSKSGVPIDKEAQWDMEIYANLLSFVKNSSSKGNTPQ